MQNIDANQIMLVGLNYTGFSKAKQASRLYWKLHWGQKHYGLVPHVVVAKIQDLCTMNRGIKTLQKKHKG